MADHRSPDRAASFDGDAEGYRDGRPGYPPAVYDLLAARCGLRAGARVLEIGPGPGQATVDLLDRGAAITAVEPGHDLARVLTARTAGRPVTVVNRRFEDAEIAPGAFDLVVSATAFHWVDPDVGLPKAAAALTSGGWLALWWAVYGDTERPDPFHEALVPLLAEKAPQLLDDAALGDRMTENDALWAGRIGATPGLGPVETAVIRWEGRHSPEELRAMFATFSGWIVLDEPRRTELLDDVARLARDDFGGVVVRPYLTATYLAQKAGNAPNG